jgi:hypothetical protein
MAAAPAGSAGDSDARDAAWLSRLHRNRSGRVLQDHLACVEDRLDSHGREGSIQEAINNRRCFLRAVNSHLTRGRALPCGLPSPVPRFVAIVNLSGQRMVLTSNYDTMLRKLCARSWSMHPDMLNEQLGTFTAFLDHATMTAVMPSGSTAKAHAEQFVLITYSLPWQAGMGTAFWEVNAVSLIGDAQGTRFVYDRMCSLTSMSTHVFAGRSTLNERGTDDGVCLRAGQPDERVLDFIGPEQIKAFGDAYAAVSLDFENDGCQDALPATGASTDGTQPLAAMAGARGGGLDGGVGLAAAKAKATDATMRGILEAMKRDRIKEQSATKALQAKLDALTASHAAELQAKEEDMLAKVDEALSRATNRERVADAEVAEIRAEFDGVRTKMANMLVEQSEGRSQHAELTKKFEKLKRQEASKDKLHNTAMSKQSNEIKRLQEQLQTEKRAHGEVLAELAKAHAQALERAASQGANERTALKQKLTSTELMCNQLAENAENSGRELSTAQARIAALRSEAQGWKSKHERAAAASGAIAARNGALIVAQTTLLAEVALLEAATPPAPPTALAEPIAGDRVYLLPVRSAGVSTDTQGTATHSAAETQTADARVLAEHLPEGALRELLKPPPAQRQAPPPATTKALATTDDEPPPEPPPSPTATTGSTQEPPASAAAAASAASASAPLNASASPFGSPAMACLQAEAAFNHVLEWMRYFGAMQLHQQGVISPHAAGPPRSSPPPMMMMHQQPPYSGNHRGRPQHYPHHHHRGGAGSGY